MTPRVSIVVTSYQHERYIETALESVLAQRGVNLEILVGDDGSTDASPEIIMSLARRHPETIIPVLRGENDGTEGRTLYVELLARTTGEFVANLDGDDYWTDPDKLATQVRFLDQHPACAMCCHNVVIHFEDDGRTDRRYFGEDVFENFSEREILIGSPIPSCSMVFRRTAILPLPAWYEQLASDWALHLIAARAGEVWRIPTTSGVQRMHRGSAYSGSSMLKARLYVAESYGLFVPTVSPGLRGLCRELLADAWVDCAFEYVQLDRRADARRALRRSYAALRLRTGELRLWSKDSHRTRIVLWVLLPLPVKRDLRPRTPGDEA
jgi:glycosyltransferase involved in cell wall biosynthesis